MTDSLRKFTCTNCGQPVSELYKKYSPSVLKLTTCQSCHGVADKYVEYDPVIVIIDLVLLNKEAYRHILFNTEFKVHWKLALILHVIEAYYEWTTKPSKHYKTEPEKVSLALKEYATGDFEFYRICLTLCMRTFCFIGIVFLLTLLYNERRKINRARQELLLEIWKCMTLSSFGLFLFLPSLIWGGETVQDYNLSFVVFYTTLSQLFAYRVTNNCSKVWSIFVVIFSHFISKMPTINYSVTELLKVIMNLYH